MSDTEQRYVLQSVSQALQVLKTFSSEEREFSLTEIARHLGLNPTSALRLLVTLQVHGYLEQNPDSRKYRLGVSCLELGRTFLAQNNIQKLAYPALVSLRDDCQEAVNLARLVGRDIVFLENLPGLLPISALSGRIGERAPAHCTALGKALLAYLAEDEVRALYADFDWPRYTPVAITSLDDLIEDLRSVRERGYAIDNEEHHTGLKCVGVPIRNGRQQVLAAVSVSGPTERINRKMEREGLVEKLQQTAGAISSHLA